MQRVYGILLGMITIIIGNKILSEIPQYIDGPNTVYYLTGMMNQLFTYDGIVANQDNWKKPYQELKNAYTRKGYVFKTSLPTTIDSKFRKNVKLIYCHNVFSPSLCQSLGKEILNKTIIIMTEPPHVLPNNYNVSLLKHFNRILTYNDKMIDHKKYFKYFFVQATLSMINDFVPFENKKLCTLIGSNKNFSHPDALYPERIAAINFFERYAPHEFDFFGVGWNAKLYKTYKGSIDNKTDTLKKYKFSICYENIAHVDGYITEKIFGCFIAGCVPIYWGADNISDYIPKNCFIDKRDFPVMEDLYNFIRTMQKAEYETYLKNIDNFLKSDAAYQFSIENFVHTLINVAHGS